MSPFYAHPQQAGGGPALRLSPQGPRVFATDGSLEPLRVLRATSLVFGLLTVILTFAAVWRLSRDAWIALLAGALVALNPQFLFSSAYFSNDPAAAAIGAAALWVVVRALEDVPRSTMRRHYVVGAVAARARRADQDLDAAGPRRGRGDARRDRPAPAPRGDDRHRARRRDRAAARGSVRWCGRPSTAAACSA